MPKDIKEIEYKKNNRLGWVAFFILIFHFSFIIISILSGSSPTTKIGNLSNSYVNPFFKQKWAMFAPCPVLENRMKVKYFFEDDSTDWIDPIEHPLKRHQTLRFTHHGNIAVGFYNMLYWFKIELDNQETKTNEFLDFSDLKSLRNSLGNKLLNKYINGYCLETFNRKPTSSNIDISYRDIVSEQTDHYYFKNYK